MICPRCLGADTKRNGYERRGRQVFLCLCCRRQWTHGVDPRPRRTTPPPKTKREPARWPKLLCYRCGGARAKPLSRHRGIRAMCLDCRRVFTQGGPGDLERYSVFLRERIRAAGYRGEMADEVLADAIVDVLSGNAYCWNVTLRKPTLQASGRGDWGKGSDHPAIKEANGIKDDW